MTAAAQPHRWRSHRGALAIAVLAAVIAAVVAVSGVAGRPSARLASVSPAGPLDPGGRAATAGAPMRPGPTPSGPQPPSSLPTGTAAEAVPAPFVQNFAAGSTAKPLPPEPSPTAPVPVVVSIDGCDHSYGEPDQCVPWRFPPGVTDGCAWLRAHGYGPLASRGADRLGLDTNDDAVACGPGDG